MLGEVGYDRVKKDNGSSPQQLTKVTIAPALTAGKGFLTRPELRALLHLGDLERDRSGRQHRFGQIYNTTCYKIIRSGATFGLQAETWW